MTANRAGVMLGDDNVRKISPWNNNCHSACMADFLVEGLESNLVVSDETANVLGEMVGKHYGTPKLTRQQLNALFSAPYSFSPFDWQTILGVIFRQYLIDECAKKPEYKDVVSASKQMTPKAFAILADKLKVNVDFYVADVAGLRPALSAVSDLKLEDELDEYTELKSINDYKNSDTLHVICKPGHYDRLTKNARQLNGLDDAVSFRGDYEFTLPTAPSKKYTPDLVTIYRDDNDRLRSEVKARIAEVQAKAVVSTPWHKVGYKLQNLSLKVEAKSVAAPVAATVASTSSPKVVAAPAMTKEVKIPAKYSTITQLLALKDDKTIQAKLTGFSKEYQEVVHAVKEASVDDKKISDAQQKLNELSKVHETKYESFKKSVEQLSVGFTADKTSEATKWSKLLNDAKAVDEKAVDAVGYDKTGTKAPQKYDMFVSKDSQKELDEQLARKLQQEEAVSEADRLKQEQEDHEYAVKLSKRL